MYLRVSIRFRLFISPLFKTFDLWILEIFERNTHQTLLYRSLTLPRQFTLASHKFQHRKYNIPLQFCPPRNNEMRMKHGKPIQQLKCNHKSFKMINSLFIKQFRVIQLYQRTPTIKATFQPEYWNIPTIFHPKQIRNFYSKNILLLWNIMGFWLLFHFGLFLLQPNLMDWMYGLVILFLHPHKICKFSCSFEPIVGQILSFV